VSLLSSVRFVRRYAAGVALAALTAGMVLADDTKDNAKVKATDTAPSLDPAAVDKKIIDEVKANSQVSKNLQYLCDVIGPRVTGSAKLERANNWTAEKMKEYGLTNVKLEPWEIPVGWERGMVSMTMVEPNPGKTLIAAAAAWTPGTKGKITGEVVYLDARTKDDLAKYKGKLKDAIILRSPPSNVAPISDMTYLGSRPQQPAPATPPMATPPAEKKDPQPPVEKKDEPAADEPTDDPKKEEPKKDDPKKEEKKEKKEEPKKAEAEPQPQPQPPAGGRGGPGGGGFGDFQSFRRELSAFLRSEGAACMLTDSGKPHGLLVTTGGWSSGGGGDRAGQEPMPALYITHEHYTMLYRLATAKDGPKPKVELEITNKFIPGPITVYNTVGEITGSEKPDEFVVIGAHLDSWDLGTGATDNGTGSCTVLEVARVLGALAKQGIKPKRTIRFALFSGEEQGLYGSKEYVKRHKDEMPKTSACIVHDTGTGKVLGLAMQGRAKVRDVLEPELAGLKQVDGWKGLNMRNQGGTDHLSFHAVGVPGFACDQEPDEYRLTHHTQTDTFDHAKIPNLTQAAQVMAVSAMRIANLPNLLPREMTAGGGGRGGFGGGGPGGPGGPGGAGPATPPPATTEKKEEKKDEVKKEEKK
jgi:hypothetical protein